jgi:putative oxidoreductase
MNKCKKCLQPNTLPNCISAALVLLRVVVGLAFIMHGWGKIQNPFAWMPPEAPVPGFLQMLAAVSEFGGGIALILGLLTSLALLGMMITMAVAVTMHAFVMGDPFVNPMGGSSYELALVYFSIFAVLMATGPGKFSADAKIFGMK